CARVAFVPIGGSRWLRGGLALPAGPSGSEGAVSSSILRQAIPHWTCQTKFPTAIASSGSLAPHLRGTGPAGIHLVDVDSQKWFDYADATTFPRSFLYRLEGRRLRKLERELPTWAKAVTLVSDAEAKLFRSFSAPGPVYTVTNGTDLEYFRPMETAEEEACVFVGALDYRPNIDAACWFVEAVW